MANESGSSSQWVEDWEVSYGAESGWVEARTSCDHLASLASDLSHIPHTESPCSRCQNPAENWLCLSCKDVLCSRFINKHMLKHHQETAHCIALSFSDLSVWCFACESYLDVQMIQQLQPAYEIAHLLKFGKRPPFRSVGSLPSCDSQNTGSSASS